ncbi:MAG: pyridine nucleotide-disulfide oxidoreductase [Lachnospiraceae bacterium]|nr:pyridine nucleotide-disulfide oxidoreductase [Lachnospiraceae bacterium]
MEEAGFKTITPEEFAGLDFSLYTLVDLREPDELLISSIEGAINIPFSKISGGLSKIPKDKPVILYCHSGDLSEEIAELLYERGYDVSHVEGGYAAYRKLTEGDTVKPTKNNKASREFIDAKGLKCPGPIVKVADYLREKPDGTKIHVEATEDAFYSDIRIWCERTGNTLENISFEEGIIRADITKSERPAEKTLVSAGNDKTFVVFSGDLDKTIAAFIMANGAAAMGRNVTIFFTFWGLNILRRPDKVKVKKKFIEKMFGFMMPRGTRKLGLSRMNMAGMGAKMIRSIMKSKGVSSLEELVESAKAHGVHLVACQMSMDIMGIHKEELIDGVELGGVSTFLGSGEQSDMSLFI